MTDSTAHPHPHDHRKDQDHAQHQHTHGAVDPSVFATDRAIHAVQWSSLFMLLTAVFQAVVAWFSGSVALLADTIHNFGDSGTAIPLWIAFNLGKRKATKRFTYGYGRVEDLAGLVVVIFIFLSAIVAAFESVKRLIYPQPVEHLAAVMIAAVVGFLGNEVAARYRIRVGKQVGSAALVADGYHARTDAITSLSVLVGALGVKLGYPLADPVVGLIITGMILKILWESGGAVFNRLLDGVDPEVVDEIVEAARKIEQVQEVSEVRVRWIGHRMHAEVNVAVPASLSVEEAHEIAMQIRHQLMHDLSYLSNATIHVDPPGSSGEEFHRIAAHNHDDFPTHSH